MAQTNLSGPLTVGYATPAAAGTPSATTSLQVSGDIVATGRIISGGVVTAAGCTITNAAGGANQCLVSYQVTDTDGNNLSYATSVEVYLSDAATGQGLTATTASGTVGAYSGTTGFVLGALTASKAFQVVTNASGLFELTITDTALTHFYPCIVVNGTVVVGAQLTNASY